jgi:hypothetical protein
MIKNKKFITSLKYISDNGEKICNLINENEIRYNFMDNHEYAQLLGRSPKDGFRVYWDEMLQRVHMCSVSGILRFKGWADGFLVSHEADNLYAMASTMRGLIEASADTACLIPVAQCLAERPVFKGVNEALTGKSTRNFKSEQLDNILTHFFFARKLSSQERKVMPKEHEALKVKDYVEIFEASAEPIYSLYSSLSLLSHPSAHSLHHYFKEKNGWFEYSDESSANKIDSIIEDYNNEIHGLVYPVNACIMALKVLNSYKIERLHTPFLDSIRFDHIPLGKIIGKNLGIIHW